MNSRKNTRVPIWMVLCLVLFSVLLLHGSVNEARAVLSIKSDDYSAVFETSHIGITLNENGSPIVTTGDGKAQLLSKLTKYNYGTVYPEELTVTNSGSIDEFVRVTVYQYWRDEKGNKRMDLNPAYIDLKFVTGSGWVIDPEYSKDPERTVLYYTALLPSGATSSPFASEISINGDIKRFYTQTVEKDENTGYTVITNEYLYNGKQFCVEIQADGVQTHNAEDAILSAWGRKVTVKDGTLKLS